MKNYILTGLSICISFLVFSQTETFKFAHYNETRVVTSKGQISDPWAGGLNNPQVNKMDVNLDGIEDLVVFDRQSQSVKAFLKDSIPGSENYIYHHETSKLFPLDINDIFLVRDYNNDGKPDIFTNNSPYFFHGNGLKVYKNISDTVLKFELVSAFLPATDGLNVTTVYSLSSDIPVIDDIDGDGDLDILAAAIWSFTFQYYENISPNHDSLEYVLRESCWGRFSQDVNDSVRLNITCKGATQGSSSSSSRHAGSSITTLDLNGDDVKEILIGDPDKPYTIMLTNGGTPTASHMNAVDYSFPSSPTTNPIDLINFTSAYHLDINEDNNRDLIVTPNQYRGSIDTGNVWLYKNFGTDNVPDFRLEKKNYLVENQIDVGTSALPTFGDISGDSVPDMLIGNVGYFQSYDPSLFETSYKSYISYYKNTGTKNEPEFELQTIDLLGLTNNKFVRLAPTLGDIDGDGDNDLLLGETSGNIHFYENTAPIGSEAIFTFVTDNFMSQSFGVNCSPLLFDIDKDDKLDLLVGQQNGHIKLYLNQGSTSNPVYTNTITDTLGGIYHYKPAYDNNMVLTVGDIMGDSNNILIVGNADGVLFFYEGIDSNYLGTYTELDRIKASNSPIAPALVNINHSDSLELFVGEETGGILAFQLDANRFIVDDTIPDDTTSVKNPLKKKSSFLIYPNPSEGNFTVKVNGLTGNGAINIYDLSGKNVFQTPYSVVSKSQINSIQTDDLRPGIYLITISLNDTMYRQKLIIQ